MERSRPHGGRWNTAQLLRSIEESQFSEERRPAESSHGRSLVSRLGMSEISCFPSSRSRRTSSRAELLDDSIRRSGSQRRVVAPQPRSDTARLGTLSSRRDRGKGQMFPAAGSSGMVIRNNELANFEEIEDGRVAGNDSAEGLSYFNLPDSEAVSDSEDQGVDMEEPSENERLHTHKSPSLLVTGNSNLAYSKRKTYSSARGSSSSGSTSGVGGKAKLGDHLRGQGGLNLRRHSPSSSSSRASSALDGLRPQKLRVSRRSIEVSDARSSSSNSRSNTSDYDGVLSYQPSSLAARRSASYLDSSSDLRNSGRSRYDVNETMPRSIRDTALRHHTGAGEARFGRSSSGRTTGSRIHAHTEELQNSHGSASGGHIFTRRNISNCFPALGSSQARRSSSPRQIAGQRSPRRFTSTGAHVSQLPASSSFSSSSAQPPVSLLAAALEVMPSSSTYQTSGREQLPESYIHGSAPSQELSWPTTASGWEYHRPRLMAEGLAKILMALERVESDEELTHEQLLMLEATVLFGGMALHDQHSDWRMDVDNMSYEELLALGERIGSVSTGLTKELISTKLRKHIFFFDKSEARNFCEELKCSICQEEYNDGDQLGKIDCGHKYHTDCIRQWLGLKNICPICKATALS